MAHMGFGERVRIAAVRAHGVQRRAATRLLSSRLLRWRHGRAPLGELVMVPGDLRSCDPSFWPELNSGILGLCGATAELRHQSPFEIVPPTTAWHTSLHGFGWLRHLAVSEDSDAQREAREIVLDWLGHRHFQTGVARDPAVRARRIISWISHASFLLDGAPVKTYDLISRGVAHDVMMLTSTWRTARGGYPRLLALTGLVTAHLATKGRERQLANAMAVLVDEIGRQILGDGGHISRNPAVLVELLLDWLPLKSCFDARGLQPPDAFTIAISRMLAMLRFLRLGDGGVARFNGAGAADPASIATLSAYDDRPLLTWGLAPLSRYGRLESGASVVLIDAGPPPPLLMSGAAHAGCLSFEMSDGHHLVFVNGGAPGGADGGWRAISRATASHSTVCVGEVSSGRLVRNEGLEGMVDGIPMQWPSVVNANVALAPALDDTNTLTPDGPSFEGTHDGYLQRLGVMHRRHLQLSSDGHTLTGRDILATRGQDRLRRDLPFSVHFHLHPTSRCELEPGGQGDMAARIFLPNGIVWRLQAQGGAMTLEESTFFAGNFGPRPALQIVLRGACAGASELKWQVVRVDRARPTRDEARID